MKTGYYNRSICRNCGGKCCKNMPGISIPEDFGAPNQGLLLKNLIKIFKSGNWVIDWWEGDPRKSTNNWDIDGLFVRPKHKGENNRKRGINNTGLRDPSWGGECIFLTDKGCSLPAHKRPKGCRMLEPKISEKCIIHGENKQEAAIAWIPYHAIIEAAEQKVLEQFNGVSS